MSMNPTESAAAPGGKVVPLAYAPPAKRVPLFSAEAWSPLKIELFRSLYIATSIAQVGTWVREAGGPILMSGLTDGRHDQPAMIAKVLTYSNLPICLFSVFAGALADVLDRRLLLIVTQAWMLVFSALLGLLTVSGHITPLSLLALTFIVGTGTAAAGPALQALLPELVPKKDLALAINLNSVALNVARALGPALFIVVIAMIPGRAGIGVSFFVTAASFIWAIWVLVRWKRAPQTAAIHGENIWNAIRAGFNYTIHSPANRAILLRVLTFIIPAVVMWSQIPVIATGLLGVQPHHELKPSAALFAFVGLGAILGVLLMPGLQKRYKIDPVVNVCTLFFAGGLILLSFIHSTWLAWIVMAFLGVNWVIIPTNFNTATQTSVPIWVKGRAISFYLTVLFGSFAIGARIWGACTTYFTTADHSGISTSLLIGGISMAFLLVLAKWFPLTLNQELDLTPAFAGGTVRPVFPDIVPPSDPNNAGPMPVTGTTPGGLDPRVNASPNGPVQVSLQYDVDPTRVQEFLKVMRRVSRLRRRNGAASWQLEPTSSIGTGAITYLEKLRYRSAAEYTRQPARMTKSDYQVLEEARGFHTSEGDLPGRGEILPGNADSRAPLKAWALGRVAHSFDRFFDETAALFDRFSALRERERARRKPRYREVRVRLPE